jgi:hypothetical protein
MKAVTPPPGDNAFISLSRITHGIVLSPKKSVNYVLEAKCSLENDTITIPIETNYYLLKINFHVFFLFIYLDIVVMITRLAD